MERSKFISATDEILNPKQKESDTTEKLLSILNAKQLSELPEEAQEQPAAKELKDLLGKLKAFGISNAEFDGTLMRGFDYYTGIVFEVFDKNPDNNRSMLGGGRYDGLVGLFGVQPVPTVGFGWGDVTLTNFLQGHNLLPKLKPETDVYVVLVGDVLVRSQKVISSLRYKGLNVAVDLSGKKIGDQFKTADKKGIIYALVIGEDELQKEVFKLKNLKTGEEASGSVADLIKVVQGDSD
jgi:histidyl-tRNA synthetase